MSAATVSRPSTFSPMKAEMLRSLKPGDRVLVMPPAHLAGPPRAVPPAEAVFVAAADDPRTALPVVVVCGLPAGWADEEDVALNLRAVWAGQILDRVTDDERLERMRRRLEFMARMAEGDAPRRKRSRSVARASPDDERELLTSLTDPLHDPEGTDR